MIGDGILLVSPLPENSADGIRFVVDTSPIRYSFFLIFSKKSIFFFFFFNTVRRRRFEIFEISQVTRSTTHNRPVTELLTSTSPLRKGLDIRFPRFNDDTRQQSFRLHLSGNARFPKIFPSEINEFQRLLERKGFAPSP